MPLAENAANMGCCIPVTVLTALYKAKPITWYCVIWTKDSRCQWAWENVTLKGHWHVWTCPSISYLPLEQIDIYITQTKEMSIGSHITRFLPRFFFFLVFFPKQNRSLGRQNNGPKRGPCSNAYKMCVR